LTSGVPDSDPSMLMRDHEQGADHHDEAEVLVGLLAEHRPSGLAQCHSQLQQDGERDEDRDEGFVAVRVPPVRREERGDRDRQQQHHKGQDADERELGAEHGAGD
jgi:hypothetical protein